MEPSPGLDAGAEVEAGKRFAHSANRWYKRSRGMSKLWDIVDLLGGYPFEVARPEAVFDFFRSRGFQLEKLLTDGGYGCNQSVFLQEHSGATPKTSGKQR